MDQSDFDSKHNERFHLKGKSTLRNFPKGKRNILLIGPQTELISAERSFMAPALGVIRLAGFAALLTLGGGVLTSPAVDTN